jgi:pimeloyl-ACP methyl ester carboxylesterase
MDGGATDRSAGLASPTSHSYYSQRLRLHFLDWGNPSAPPLMLVHGNRDHAHNWDWVAERFRHDYHVVAPDFRGHGDSQWSMGSNYGVSEYVYDIAQLIHQQDLAPLRIVAHSLGGMVSLRYAGTFPENVERLVIVEGTGPPLMPAETRPSAPERMRNWIQSQRSLAGRLPRRYGSLDAAHQRMQEANPHLSFEQARHLTTHGTNQNEDGTYSWKFDNYVHAGPALDIPGEEVRALWANIACPVLLVTGSESWHRENVENGDLVSAFTDARHEVIDNAGHWVHHDQLDRFCDLVRTFLA